MLQTNNVTNDSWVLGLVGVGASLLAAGGQFSIMHSLMGIILFTIVTTVDNLQHHNSKFIRAYACVLAMCLVLICASPINAMLVAFGIAGRSIVDIGANGENYLVETTHFVLSVLWIYLTVYIYLKHQNAKSENS